VRLGDTKTGYGLVSITLHWLTVVVIFMLLVVGSLAQDAPAEMYADLVHLHTTTGIAAYVVLWARVIWRLAVKHPGPLPKQRTWYFHFGKVVHWTLVIAVGVMLVTGPLIRWTAGLDIEVFDWSIPSPIDFPPQLYDAVRQTHAVTAAYIAIASVIHILGVIKHALFNKDGGFDKMIVVAKGDDD